jgi:hypothetical protein
MHAVLNSALPIFALILTGFVCGYFGVFDRTATDNLNRFAVYLALPSLMFVAMSKITPDQVRQFGFVGAFCGGFAVSFAVAFAISRFRGRRVANASIEGLDAGYSNVGFMGIPMCLLVFGPESAPASIIATLFTACVLFLFAVVVVEIDLQKGDSFWSTGARVIVSVLRSPLLIAFYYLARRRSLAGGAGLHRTVSGAGAGDQRRYQVDRHSRHTEADPAAGRHSVPRLLRLFDAAAVVALGRHPERAADRIGALYHCQTLRPRSRRHLRLDPRFACIRRTHRLIARRPACANLIHIPDPKGVAP